MKNSLDNYFKIKERHSNIKTEILAGITTFLTMAYIIVVNPLILSDAGIDKGSVFYATIFIAAISSIIMGFFANLPISLAPGMGLNAFFTYVIVLTLGLSWQTALFAVFCSGVLFLLISATSLRKKIILAIPNSLKVGIGLGIGLFLLYIGLQNSGIVVKNDATISGLGDIKSIEVILSCIGFLLILILEARKVKGSLLISILIITVLSYFLTDNSFSGVIGKLPEYNSFMKINFDLSLLLNGSFLFIIFSFLFVDFFDSTGTIIAVFQAMDDKDDKQTLSTDTDLSQPHTSKRPLIVDSFATILGSILGTSTATVYIESATGVKQGGRTGLTAIVTGLLFLISLIFFPLINTIPAYATAPALIYIGFLFLRSFKQLDLSNLLELIPAGVSAMLIPFTFSITYGIIFGFLSYVVILLGEGKIKQINPFVWIISLLGLVYLIFG